MGEGRRAVDCVVYAWRPRFRKALRGVIAYSRTSPWEKSISTSCPIRSLIIPLDFGRDIQGVERCGSKYPHLDPRLTPPLITVLRHFSFSTKCPPLASEKSTFKPTEKPCSSKQSFKIQVQNEPEQKASVAARPPP